VTIDLSNLSQIGVSADRNVVSVGPGNRWQRVYDTLDPLGIAVSGGRWGNVGVAGLLLGGMLYSAEKTRLTKKGGLSFFQGTKGPACDGVISHEVRFDTDNTRLTSFR
jgi:hypothetical protein